MRCRKFSMCEPLSFIPLHTLLEQWDHLYKSWLCKHSCSLLSGTTGSEGLSQLLRLSGGTSRGCGQHNGFIIEPWKYSLFSTIPPGLCPARNAHPISLASQPSLSTKVPSKCHILQDMLPEIPPLEAYPIHSGGHTPSIQGVSVLTLKAGTMA